jgi:hypothetical protein
MGARMLTWARISVFLVFAILAASFVASTAVLRSEFPDAWVDFAVLDSHLFIFFPTVGIVALIAFFTPSVLFLDMYWRHIPYGKLRFLAGFVIAAAASYWIAGVLLDSPRRDYWESSPKVLAADAGEPAGCVQTGLPCQRLPILTAVRNLRLVSQSRLGLDGLIRDCLATKDSFIEPDHSPERRRYCLASTPYTGSPALQSDDECCKAQGKLMSFAQANHALASTRSLSAEVHALLLPFKVYFLLMVFAISILLAIHHKDVERHYGAYLPRMEFGLFVGALCVLFFPLMSQAFLQSSEVLSGAQGRGTFSYIVPAISLLSMVWVLLIGLFFYRRRSDDRLVTVGRFFGILVSNIGIIKYNLLVTVFVLIFGAGMSEISLWGLAIGCVCAAGAVLASMAFYGPRKALDK